VLTGADPIVCVLNVGCPSPPPKKAPCCYGICRFDLPRLQITAIWLLSVGYAAPDRASGRSWMWSRHRIVALPASLAYAAIAWLAPETPDIAIINDVDSFVIGCRAATLDACCRDA
jgi:hypothetical protein